MTEKRYIFVSGPAGVGKSPLLQAIPAFYPGIRYFKPEVIRAHESRPNGPRPDETDKFSNPRFFRPQKDIESLEDDPSYLTGFCRGNIQACNLAEIATCPENIILSEQYYALGEKLLENSFLRTRGVRVVGVFISPLSGSGMRAAQRRGFSLERYCASITAAMVTARNAMHGKDICNREATLDTVARAIDAYDEMKAAVRYHHVLVNPYGEAHPFWCRNTRGEFAGPPRPPIMAVIEALAEIMTTGSTSRSEHWGPDLFAH